MAGLDSSRKVCSLRYLSGSLTGALSAIAMAAMPGWHVASGSRTLHHAQATTPGARAVSVSGENWQQSDVRSTPAARHSGPSSRRSSRYGYASVQVCSTLALSRLAVAGVLLVG